MKKNNDEKKCKVRRKKSTHDKLQLGEGEKLKSLVNVWNVDDDKKVYDMIATHGIDSPYIRSDSRKQENKWRGYMSKNNKKMCSLLHTAP